eukprot:783113-Prorocentrum_minimum.AAC.1
MQLYHPPLCSTILPSARSGPHPPVMQLLCVRRCIRFRRGFSLSPPCRLLQLNPQDLTPGAHGAHPVTALVTKPPSAANHSRGEVARLARVLGFSATSRRRSRRRRGPAEVYLEMVSVQRAFRSMSCFTTPAFPGAWLSSTRIHTANLPHPHRPGHVRHRPP